MLPHYLSIGVSYHEFMHSTPKVLKAYDKAFDKKIEMIDSLVWRFCGEYFLSAVSVAVEHCLAGKKAKLKYTEKPILSKVTITESENDNEGIAVFEMKKRTKMLERSGLKASPS